MAINDDSKMLLSTRYNMLKIYANGSTTVSVGASTYDGTTFRYIPDSYLLYTHSLGYIPRARVWYEPVSGQLWPISPNQYDNTDGGSGTPLSVTGMFYLTTTGLYISITSPSATSMNFRFRIYLDE